MANKLVLLYLALCVAAAPSKRAVPAGVPDFVTKYAPMMYLDTSEAYLPADIGGQLKHTQPEVNFKVVQGAPNPLTLDNLNKLNDFGDVYLTSKDNIETVPTWLRGVKPDSNGKTNGAVSCAIIVNDHGKGLVDAFYMYFYAFDFGGVYFGFNIGDHVGDWEHNMIRFKDGKPQSLWFSQHANGEAFTYEAVEKMGVRPVGYVANGTHANYATAGTHDHTIPNVNLPFGPVEDHANKGPLWDVAASAYFYSYDVNTKKFAAYDKSTPVNWLYYTGRWGDQQYANSDSRQEGIFNINGLYKYVSGPTGPEDKQLNRTKVCPDNGKDCILRPILTPKV